jgi:hypothetical protein
MAMSRSGELDVELLEDVDSSTVAVIHFSLE